MPKLAISQDRITASPATSPANFRTRRRRLQRTRKRQNLQQDQISATPAAADCEDRISTLPDEIIHQILARLRSPKQVRKATVLSKTWTHLVKSYPIFEFNERDFPSSEDSAAALEQQLSQRPTVCTESVRIKFKPNWNNSSPTLDRILDLVAKLSPRAIDIRLPTIRNSIPTRFFSPGSKKFLLRLNFLRLERCNFLLYEDRSITSLGSLRVLYLDEIRFLNSRVLNSMIAGAVSSLETLILKSVSGQEKIRVDVNNPNLKFMQVDCSYMAGLKITEAHSLEVVRLSLDDTFDLSFSLAPSLKELHIGGRRGWGLVAGWFNKIIPELPSLELLALSDYNGDDKLTIVNNNNKLREIRLKNMSWECDMEIDVPSVIKLCYDGRTFCFPPTQSAESSTFKPNQILEPPALKQRKIYTAPSSQMEEDRISRLPDKVIHQILACLRSSKQVAKVNILSKRWTHLLRSYPVLEFDQDEDYYYYGRKEPQERLAQATLEKFSPRGGNIPMEAVRVRIKLCLSFYSGFLDQLLNLAAWSSSLQEIDIDFGKRYDYSFGFADEVTPYYIPESFFLPSPSDCKQFLRLNVLKLTQCNLHLYGDLVTKDNNNNPFSSLGRSLKVLILDQVNFPDDEVLNSIIAGASLLETLTLKYIDGVGRFQIQNHANLKAVFVVSSSPDNFEITGAPSLKKFVCDSSTESVQISSTPNLEEVFIGSCMRLGDEAMNKLIEELRFLKLLTLNKFVERRQMRIINSGGHHKVFIGRSL